MSSGQAIKAVEMFTKHGASKNVSVVREVVIGLTIGLGFGALWKVRPDTPRVPPLRFADVLAQLAACLFKHLAVTVKACTGRHAHVTRTEARLARRGRSGTSTTSGRLKSTTQS
jgi:hypothetical protein